MSLRPNVMFTAPVYLEKNFILLSPETPLTQELLQTLSKWRYVAVYSDGEPKIPSDGIDFSKPETDISQIDQAIQVNEQFKKSYSFYFDLISYVEELFHDFILKSVLDVREITERLKKLINMIKDDRDIILGFTGMQHTIENYIIIHSINTTILAVSIGDYLKFPPHRLIELGLATFFHDIGMIKLPTQLYINSRKLTPQEKKNIMTHTILGYRVLKSYNFSEKVALGALEHHERMDGSGYPNRLRGEDISIYARIIAVTDAYEGQVRNRPYKKAKNAHISMLSLLKNENKRYDETFIKVLVYCLSIYPLGSYVLLNNNAKGIVYKTNVNNPRFPTVKVVEDGEGKKIPESEIILVETTGEKGISISRSLMFEEVNNLQ